MPFVDAGWSSLVARRAHNPKVVGSNPSPATTKKYQGSQHFVETLFFMILKTKLPPKGGVLHCFSEDWAFAKEALSLHENLYISFAGNLT